MIGDGRVMIVTGGSRGIGAAITRRAVRDGYAVCLSYAQDSAAADALVQELGNDGGRVVAVRSDVAASNAVHDLFERAESVLGPVTDLVNNAGITGRRGLFRDLDDETLRRTIEINITGTMLCAREAIRRWEARGVAGRIVNISSIAATLGAAGEYVHYAATKAAVETFTLGLAKEVGPGGTRVNGVSPGTIHTDIHAAAGDPDRPARMAAVIPMRRAGEAEEIANAVIWLLSDEASFVTGAILRVSGGV
jgi:NAD(P)-dependent dehydrogenase (short-subunit alcohol dehydrogenase family)